MERAMSDIAERLRTENSVQLAFGNDLSDVLLDAALEIERLREKCDKQAAMLQRLFPDKFPWTPFITSVGGGIDENRMPERLYVVPAYGCDFSYVYERTDKTVGPEW
jgi:hypothetical protein